MGNCKRHRKTIAVLAVLLETIFLNCGLLLHPLELNRHQESLACQNPFFIAIGFTMAYKKEARGARLLFQCVILIDLFDDGLKNSFSLTVLRGRSNCSKYISDGFCVKEIKPVDNIKKIPYKKNDKYFINKITNNSSIENNS